MSTAKNLYDTVSHLDSEERDRLLKEQLPAVSYIARRIHNRLPRHISLEDLVHSGVLGLIDAVHKYDPGRNVQFKSYAKFRIRGAILDSLRGLDWSPRDLRAKARKVQQAELKLRNTLGRPPTESELAQEVGISLDELQELLADLRSLDVGSLNGETVDDGGDLRWSMHEPQSQEPDAFSVCCRSEMSSMLREAIEDLPVREKQVLSLYYFEELTMKEVGAVLGVSESRICQIHSAAMIRLRGRMQERLDSRSVSSSTPRVLRPPVSSGSSIDKKKPHAKVRT